MSSYLFEIGTEELPPTALKNLSLSLCEQVGKSLRESGLHYADVRTFATPRRMALLFTELADETPKEVVKVWGPPARVAFDSDGKPTKAALAFCQRNNIEATELVIESDGKTEKVCCLSERGGEQTSTLLPTFLADALAKLPVPKRMRWGASRTEFVRPVHWLVLLRDDAIIDATLLGKRSGRETRGHRFLAQKNVSISHAQDYAASLKKEGKVIADFSERRTMIRAQIEEVATKLGGTAAIDDALLDEVTALVEWPVALAGDFDPEFLAVPAEALVSSMKEHQKYFHVVDAKGTMMPHFITVSNIESADYRYIRQGNEKVIRPRLADAAFFFDTDKKTTLDARRDKLKNVVFQAQLGSIFDKTERIKSLVGHLCKELGLSTEGVARAAELCKSDLVSAMVYEFPEMQGIAGYHYALSDGEPEHVAVGIREHYQPKFAGDAIPSSDLGAILALADRLDTIVGIFGIGQIPTGSKDPFGLRRASLGVLRILIESGYDLDLRSLIGRVASEHSNLNDPEAASTAALDYVLERLRALFEDKGISPEVYRAVASLKPSRPLDIEQRVNAVNAFAQREESASLASANKRVANILTKQKSAQRAEINASLLVDKKEQALAKALFKAKERVEPLFASKDYGKALSELATLREPVDAFFDNVLVMADQPELQTNRIALLGELRSLFLEVADISYLVPAK